MVRYLFANNSTNELVKIDSLFKGNESSAEKFTCISCGKELIPRLGKIRQKHFAHKEMVTCSGETYLHILGKKILFAEYTKCLINKVPFYIELYSSKLCNRRQLEFGLRCNLGENLNRVDLTKYLTEIKLEQRVNNLIPDVLLTGSREERIFFEIAVTHSSSVEKKQSGQRLIEMEVGSEDDLKAILDHCISEKDRNVIFLNFKPKDFIGHFCGGECEKLWDLFTINNEASPRLHEMNLSQISNYLKRYKDHIVHYEITSYSSDFRAEKFKYHIRKAYLDKREIKNCFICRYHGINLDAFGFDDPIFCKFLKVTCNSNKASTCKYFKADASQ